MGKFSGRVVLITGATSGIGEATAVRFAAAGAKLVLTGRDVAALARVKSAAETAGAAAVLTVVGDLTKKGTCEKIIQETSTAFNELHVLVNNAGFMANRGSIEEETEEGWAATMDLNLTSVQRLTKLAIEMLKVSKGCIVNVSSIAGCRPIAGNIAYCVSKGAMDQLTQCLALELAKYKIRVNSVNPGTVRTNFHQRVAQCTKEQATALYETLHDLHPLGRIGEPEDIAGPILFLASDDASWITGTILNVDRGRHCAGPPMGSIKKDIVQGVLDVPT